MFVLFKLSAYSIFVLLLAILLPHSFMAMQTKTSQPADGGTFSHIKQKAGAKDDLPAQSYELRIIVNRSDGGDISVLRDFVLQERHGNGATFKGKKGDMLEIETVLNALYGINAKYIPVPKGSNVEEQKKGAKIRLNKFRGVPELDDVQILAFLNGLGLVDGRWQIPPDGKPISGGLGAIDDSNSSKKMPVQPSQQEPLFEPMFTGHAMVLLLSGSGDHAREVARFHFNKAGLNLFISEEKKNYVVDENLKEEELIGPGGIVRKRTIYTKEHFPSFPTSAGEAVLRTRSLTMEEMKRIAFQLIDGRPWVVHGGYTCMHFVYAFVLATVEKGTREKLMSQQAKTEAWPKSFGNLVEFAEHADGISPFEDIVHRDMPFKRFLQQQQLIRSTHRRSKNNEAAEDEKKTPSHL